jgi:DNA topoisomerase VI subunit A
MKGSMNMSYDSANLTTPDVKWLGVRPSDLTRFNIPQQCRIKMTDEDIKTGKRLVLSGFLVYAVTMQMDTAVHWSLPGHLCNGRYVP